MKKIDRIVYTFKHDVSCVLDTIVEALPAFGILAMVFVPACCYLYSDIPLSGYCIAFLIVGAVGVFFTCLMAWITLEKPLNGATYGSVVFSILMALIPFVIPATWPYEVFYAGCIVVFALYLWLWTLIVRSSDEYYY